MGVRKHADLRTPMPASLLYFDVGRSAIGTTILHSDSGLPTGGSDGVNGVGAARHAERDGMNAVETGIRALRRGVRMRMNGMRSGVFGRCDGVNGVDVRCARRGR